jgi:hypothetical protein
MSFDELLTRVRRRLEKFQKSRRSSFVLDQSALVDAVNLWEAATPVDPAHSTDNEQDQLASARQMLGWLYFLSPPLASGRRGRC